MKILKHLLWTVFFISTVQSMHAMDPLEANPLGLKECDIVEEECFRYKHGSNKFLVRSKISWFYSKQGFFLQEELPRVIADRALTILKCHDQKVLKQVDEISVSLISSVNEVDTTLSMSPYTRKLKLDLKNEKITSCSQWMCDSVNRTLKYQIDEKAFHQIPCNLHIEEDFCEITLQSTNNLPDVDSTINAVQKLLIGTYPRALSDVEKVAINFRAFNDVMVTAYHSEKTESGQSTQVAFKVNMLTKRVNIILSAV